jgi:hypothetical protein
MVADTQTMTEIQWHRLTLLAQFLCPLFRRTFWRSWSYQISLFRTTSLPYVWLGSWNTPGSSITNFVSGWFLEEGSELRRNEQLMMDHRMMNIWLTFDKILWESTDNLFSREFCHLNSNYDHISDGGFHMRWSNSIIKFCWSEFLQNCWKNKALILEFSTSMWLFVLWLIALYEMEAQFWRLWFRQPVPSESPHEVHFESLHFL